MALSSESESVLESAMKKITGEPGASAGGSWRPAQQIPENVIGYGSEFGSGPKDVATPSAANPYVAPAAAAPDPFIAQTQALQSQAATSAAPAAATPPALWKSYGEYFANNPEAQRLSSYTSSDVAGSPAALFHDRTMSKNPWRFSEEYNKYMSTQPKEYQTLASAGIDPSLVRSGVTNSVYMDNKIVPIPGADYYKNNPMTGASAAASTPAPALTAPTRPKGNISWQQDQQYWRDMDAYRKAGGK